MGRFTSCCHSGVSFQCSVSRCEIQSSSEHDHAHKRDSKLISNLGLCKKVIAFCGEICVPCLKYFWCTNVFIHCTCSCSINPSMPHSGTKLILGAKFLWCCCLMFAICVFIIELSIQLAVNEQHGYCIWYLIMVRPASLLWGWGVRGEFYLHGSMMCV